ncbi:MAG: RNA polymerase sigma-70 factor (ECF subfamily) [Myxococcota bacterium]|jgi:RNA polymerase sigma-70 factor (ECF subfamily)
MADDIHQLVLAAREGDEAGRAVAIGRLEAAFSAQNDRIYAVCLRYTGDPERARELAQDALLVAWERLEGFRGGSSFATWVFGIAKNLARNDVRKHKDQLTEDGVLTATDPVASVLRSLRRQELEEVVQAAISDLPPLDQEAVYLRYVEGMAVNQITDLLEIKAASGARGILQRCRRQLASNLHARLEELGHTSTFFRDTW